MKLTSYFQLSVHGKLLAYAKRVDAIATANNQSQKWKSIMKSFSSCENEAKDEAYAIPGGHQSAARVLAEITGIYCNIGKILGATLLVFVFLGINLYSSLVALGLTVVFAGIVSALHINEAFKNVVSLVISNAVHVGEIISIGRSGFKPADNPGEFVCGFVESFTWTHVIIRDFKVSLSMAWWTKCARRYLINPNLLIRGNKPSSDTTSLGSSRFTIGVGGQRSMLTLSFRSYPRYLVAPIASQSSPRLRLSG